MDKEFFYHQCWLRLKCRYPRLRKRMEEIELWVAGLGLPPKPEKKPEQGEIL